MLASSGLTSTDGKGGALTYFTIKRNEGLTPMTVVSDLQSATKVTVRPGESAQEYARRLAHKANDLTDDKWESLDEATQHWANEAIEAIRKKTKEIPLPTGIEELFRFVDEEEEEEEKSGSEESGDPTDDYDEDDKPVKKAKVKAKPVQAQKPTKAKALVKPAKKAAAKEAVGRKGKFVEGATIKVVADENPFREGSKAHDWFGRIKNGMTLSDAVAAGTPRNHIRWAHSLGHLKID